MGRVSFTPDLTPEQLAAIEAEDKARRRNEIIRERTQAKKAREEIAQLEQLFNKPSQQEPILQKTTNSLYLVPATHKQFVTAQFIKLSKQTVGKRRITLQTTALLYARTGLDKKLAITLCKEACRINKYYTEKPNEFEDAFHPSWREGLTQPPIEIINWDKRRITLRQVDEWLRENPEHILQYTCPTNSFTIPNFVEAYKLPYDLKTPQGKQELKQALHIVAKDHLTYITRCYTEYQRIINDTHIRRADQRANFETIVSNVMARIAYEQFNGCLMSDNSMNKLQELRALDQGQSDDSSTSKCSTFTSNSEGDDSSKINQLCSPTLTKAYNLWAKQDNMTLTRGVVNETWHCTRIQVTLPKECDKADRAAAEEWYMQYLPLWGELEADESARSEDNYEHSLENKKAIYEAERIVRQEALRLGSTAHSSTSKCSTFTSNDVQGRDPDQVTRELKHFLRTGYLSENDEENHRRRQRVNQELKEMLGLG